MSRKEPGDAAASCEIERLVLEAVEDAAIRGLCTEGQAEIAFSRLREQFPSMPAEDLANLVRDLLRDN